MDHLHGLSIPKESFGFFSIFTSGTFDAIRMEIHARDIISMHLKELLRVRVGVIYNTDRCDVVSEVAIIQVPQIILGAVTFIAMDPLQV